MAIFPVLPLGKRVSRVFVFAGSLVASMMGAALVTGCGAGPMATSTAGSLAMQGSVMGGQQGVASATITLYKAGATGNGSAATSMLVTPVTTDKFGFFNITGDYSCTNASDQVYIVATGGNPGLVAGTNNTALTLMTALGNCGALPSQNFIVINEITTAASAWALAPFMTGAATVGASATNAAGLQNAFADVALLANSSTGGVATNSNGLTIESGKLVALADAIASCVNSAGGTSCAPLFAAATPPGGSPPANTLGALLNVVKYPGNNVAQVFGVISSTPPFATTLTKAPNDWTMSVTVPLAQLPSSYPYPFAAPTQIDIDAQNNVWASGYYGILNEVGPQGALLSPSGYGVGDLNESFGVAIDTSGYVWVTNEESSPNRYGSVSKFQGSTMASPGTVIAGNGGTNFYDGSVSYPYGISADASGDVFLANYYNGSSTEYATSTNAVIASYLGYGNGSFVVASAADGSGGVWLADNSSYTVTHVLAGGAVQNVTCCRAPNGLAVDPAGNVWVSNYSNSTVSAVSYAGATLVNEAAVGGISSPARLSVDAGGTVWIANYHGSNFSGVSSGTVAGEPAIGTAISPSTGFGLDADLLEPDSIQPDRAGNLWVANFANNDLVVFLGLATPTSTPTMPLPAAP